MEFLPKQPTVKAPADTFTGDAWFDVIAKGEPPSRMRVNAAYRSRAPQPPWGHPDFLLLAAVAAGVITDDKTKLIATTRLENVPVADVAVSLGERTGTVVVRRHRAEHRLAAAIADGTVTAVGPGATFHRDVAVEARLNGLADVPRGAGSPTASRIVGTRGRVDPLVVG